MDSSHREGANQRQGRKSWGISSAEVKTHEGYVVRFSTVSTTLRLAAPRAVIVVSANLGNIQRDIVDSIALGMDSLVVRNS